MSPDVKRQLSETGQAARDRQDRFDGPRPAFADNLGGSLRRQLDLRAAAMAAGSSRGAGRTVPTRSLALAGLVLALLVSGLALASGYLQVPEQSVAASQSAALPVQPSPSPSPSPSVGGAAATTSTSPGPTSPASPATALAGTAAPTAPTSGKPTAAPTRAAPTTKSIAPSASSTPPGILDMGALSAADNLDLTVTFSWNAYSGSGLTAYAVFYELSSSGATPSYPTSTAWATAGASKTSVTVPGIPAGDYQVRVQALCSPSGPLVVCGQTNVIHVHLSASRGASPSPTP